LTKWITENNGQVIPAYSSAPCTPSSIASVLTGMVPSDHAVFPEPFSVFPKNVSLMYQIKANKYGVSSNPYVSELFEFSAGFDKWLDLSVADTKLSTKENVMIRSRWAISGKFVTMGVVQQDIQSPFFIYAHYMDAHIPSNKDHIDEIDDSVLRLFPRRSRSRVKTYLSGCLSLDEHVMDLVEYVTNIDPSTVFILFADHGEELYEPPLYFKGHGWFPTKGLLEVPLIVVGANINYTGHFELRSILNAVKNEFKGDYGSDKVVSQLIKQKEKEKNKHAIFQWVSIVQQPLRYILEIADSEEYHYLFNRDTDPNEWLNIASSNNTKDFEDIARRHVYALRSEDAEHTTKKDLPNDVILRLKALGYLE